MIKDVSLPIKKLNDIVQRIMDSYSHEEKMRMTMNDAVSKNFEREFSKAQAKRDFVKCSTLYDQLKRRTNEIITEQAYKRAITLIDNGDIIKFMDDADRLKYNEIRGYIFIIHEMLDSAYNDMTSLLNSLGFEGRIRALSDIDKARDAIKKWGKTAPCSYIPEVNEIVLEEADRTYEALRKRMPVVTRKTDKAYNKYLKNKENEIKD